MNKVACLSCRESKRKCDAKQLTCSRCTKTGKICQYELFSKRKPATNRYVQSLKNRIRTLERVLKVSSEAGFENYKSKGDNMYPNLSELNFGRDVLDHPIQSDNETSNLKVNAAHWNLKIKDGRIFFEGPSSSRYIPSNSYSGAKLLETSPSVSHFDELHLRVFQWYFEKMNLSLPLLDETLFFSSLNNSIEHNVQADFAPKCLINCIMAIWLLYGDKKHDKFRLLAIEQVNESMVTGGATLGIIQSFILLSIIEMINGDESSSSDFIARAVAACYHLGLHVTSTDLVRMGKLDYREAKLRDNVFWCCFLVDRMRCTILGMHPYIYCTHISIQLPRSSESNVSSQELDVFRDTICFSDLQFRILQDYYSVEFSRCASLNGPDSEKKAHAERLLQLSAGEQLMEEWWKNVSTKSRFQNNKSFSAAHLQIYILTYKILMNKPLLIHPIQCTTEDICDDLPISVCTSTAKEILDICSKYNLNESLMLPQLIYGIYLSSIIFLFNRYSSNISARNKGDRPFSNGLALLEKHTKARKSVNIYYCNLMMFEKHYKNSFQLSTNSDQIVENENYSQYGSSAQSNHSSVNESNKVSMPTIAQSLDEPNSVFDPLWSDFSNFLGPLSMADENDDYLAKLEGSISEKSLQNVVWE
ncbi:CQS_1a_G0026950.mRNA.1.CDS.1 [Saccharomyces cerevisiae]|nr:CQS_1a_G0026950.mRNA.1.CDS.1 [Saccharomyces cerevisiae]CAI7337721.1 CQS_1a_G0026950.mRNA.1.CDS.1 [Saccharomyces cerevisiae]